MTQVVIPGRFNGPPGSANGGYSAGVVAGLLGGGPVAVRLRRPPPLDRSMRWDGGRLLDGDEVVAEGRPLGPDEPQVDPPDPVRLDEARDAATRYPGLGDHPFPTCFGCGPRRAEGDGLRMFPGPVEGREEVVAAPWVPHRSLLVGGEVPAEVAWAALDCTGGWAALRHAEGTFVLGTMLGAVERPVDTGLPHVATGWQIGAERRKLLCGSVLRTEAGELVGWSHQTWVRIS